MTTRPDPRLPRRLRTAELLAVGSELTTGETKDTNGSELAASLSAAGVDVRRITQLPDDLRDVTARFREALQTVDLVVSTGGLGPTPDDLTREAVSAAVGETPAVDPDVERWLRDIFARRGMRFAEVNLKQAWLIPSATSIPNGNGTAPGWWVDRPDGRVAVLLPGPPREMRPMWTGWVLPRLRERGLGDGRVVRTLRTYGIGESMVVDRLGEEFFRRSNPIVATYARADWLDIRISAVDEPEDGGATDPTAGPDRGARHGARRGEAIVDETAAFIRDALPGHVWAEGETTWAGLVAEAAAATGARIATVEAGTHGQLAALLSDVAADVESIVYGVEIPAERLTGGLLDAASQAARRAGVDVGLSLACWSEDRQTQVRAAVSTADGAWARQLELRLFQGGEHGRFRAAIAAAAFLIEALRERVPTSQAAAGSAGESGGADDSR